MDLTYLIEPIPDCRAYQVCLDGRKNGNPEEAPVTKPAGKHITKTKQGRVNAEGAAQVLHIEVDVLQRVNVGRAVMSPFQIQMPFLTGGSV